MKAAASEQKMKAAAAEQKMKAAAAEEQKDETTPEKALGLYSQEINFSQTLNRPTVATKRISR